MILNEHQVAGPKVRVNSPGSIRENKTLSPQRIKEANGRGQCLE
jgi:hypothetical protein